MSQEFNAPKTSEERCKHRYDQLFQHEQRHHEARLVQERVGLRPMEPRVPHLGEWSVLTHAPKQSSKRWQSEHEHDPVRPFPHHTIRASPHPPSKNRVPEPGVAWESPASPTPATDPAAFARAAGDAPIRPSDFCDTPLPLPPQTSDSEREAAEGEGADGLMLPPPPQRATSPSREGASGRHPPTSRAVQHHAALRRSLPLQQRHRIAALQNQRSKQTPVLTRSLSVPPPGTSPSPTPLQTPQGLTYTDTAFLQSLSASTMGHLDNLRGVPKSMLTRSLTGRFSPFYSRRYLAELQKHTPIVSIQAPKKVIETGPAEQRPPLARAAPRESGPASSSTSSSRLESRVTTQLRDIVRAKRRELSRSVSPSQMMRHRHLQQQQRQLQASTTTLPPAPHTTTAASASQRLPSFQETNPETDTTPLPSSLRKLITPSFGLPRRPGPRTAPDPLEHSATLDRQVSPQRTRPSAPLPSPQYGPPSQFVPHGMKKAGFEGDAHWHAEARYSDLRPRAFSKHIRLPVPPNLNPDEDKPEKVMVVTRPVVEPGVSHGMDSVGEQQQQEGGGKGGVVGDGDGVGVGGQGQGEAGKKEGEEGKKSSTRNGRKKHREGKDPNEATRSSRTRRRKPRKGAGASESPARSPSPPPLLSQTERAALRQLQHDSPTMVATPGIKSRRGLADGTSPPPSSRGSQTRRTDAPPPSQQSQSARTNEISEPDPDTQTEGDLTGRTAGRKTARGKRGRARRRGKRANTARHHRDGTPTEGDTSDAYSHDSGDVSVSEGMETEREPPTPTQSVLQRRRRRRHQRPEIPESHESYSTSSYSESEPEHDTHEGSPPHTHDHEQGSGEEEEEEEPPPFLPLDDFDDRTYGGMTPRDPEGSIAFPLPAYSKWFFNNGEWEWRPCTVLRFNADQSQYLIEWPIPAQVKPDPKDPEKKPQPKRKLVSRLNLRFQSEDPQAFEHRLEAAIRHRRAVERRMRYDARIDRMPLDTALPISPQTLQSIVDRSGANTHVQFVFKKLRRIRPPSPPPEDLVGPASPSHTLTSSPKRVKPGLSIVVPGRQDDSPTSPLRTAKTPGATGGSSPFPLSPTRSHRLFPHTHTVRRESLFGPGALFAKKSAWWRYTPVVHEEDAETIRRRLTRFRLPAEVRTGIVEELKKEITHQYSRTINRLIFDARLPYAPPEDTRGLPAPQVIRPAEPDAPSLGVVEKTIPHATFLERRAMLQRDLPLCNPLLNWVLRGCLSYISFIRELPFFATDEAKLHLASLQDFEATQHDMATRAAEFIARGSKDIFDDLIMRAREREPHFEMEQHRYEKAVLVVNLMLENAVDRAVMSSLTKYVELFEAYMTKTEDDALTVLQMTEYRDPVPLSDALLRLNTAKAPIFEAQVICENRALSLSPSLHEVLQCTLRVFDSIFEHACKIPVFQVPFVTGVPYRFLRVTQVTDPRVALLRDRLKKAVSDLLIPPSCFLSHFHQYSFFLETSPEGYMADLQQKKLPLQVFKVEIARHAEIQEKISVKVLDRLTLGPFELDCESMKAHFVESSQHLEHAALTVLAESAVEEALNIQKSYEDFVEHVQKRPEEPEELFELETTMAQFLDQQGDLEEKIDGMGQRFDSLEQFLYDVPQEQMEIRWKTYSWPFWIQVKINDAQKRNRVIRSEMIDQLHENQQNMTEQIRDISKRMTLFRQYSDLEQAEKIGEQIQLFEKQVADVNELAKRYNRQEDLFNEAPTDHSQLTTLIKEFQPVATLWKTAAEWANSYVNWLASPFQSLDAAALGKQTNGLLRTSNRLSKTFKSNPILFDVASQLKHSIDQFHHKMPLISKLRHPGIKRHHWIELSQEIGIPIDPDVEMPLNQLLELQLERFMPIINEITERAAAEHTLEVGLERMFLELNQAHFTVESYKDSETYVITKTDDLLSMLDDQRVNVQIMLNSPLIVGFEQRAKDWFQTLTRVRKTLMAWLQCQQQWIYFRPIFASSDIAQQCPLDTQRFDAVDRTWRKIMLNVFSNPHVLTACDSKGRAYDNFVECNNQLEQIHKRIVQYLDSKRAVFPRFYFLSNEELLDILSQSKDPERVEFHLPKCFENIRKLEFDPEKTIQGFYSTEWERIPLPEERFVVTQEKGVEHWMLELQEGMKHTIQTLLLDAYQQYQRRPREQWVLEWPGQIVLAASQIAFTSLVARTVQFDGVKGLRVLQSKLVDQLETLVSLVRGRLTPLQRITLASLLVIDVHAKDIVASLIDSNVTSPQDFEWTSQLRYYLEDRQCVVRMVNTTIPYGCEYLGNTNRLVITPLTDRCYRTLMCAVSMFMGGAPMGPAGTGKTETCKDLAKAAGKPCMVFNCSEAIRFTGMARFFKGICSTGAWSVFDEFNRLNIEVLSVVAQQIQEVQSACAEGLERFPFQGGNDIHLDPSCAVFITMNPSDESGYAGRTELPDNLKALFRPVAMMVSDYVIIAKILLFAEGFQKADLLAHKITNCFKLCSELLSSQRHYDFGMRAVKSVLLMAGTYKRNHRADTSEDYLLLKALRAANFPKLLAQDVPLFQGIMHDLFPNMDIPDDSHELIGPAIRHVMQEKRLHFNDHIMSKCLQLYGTLEVRHGVILVGGTGSGKTRCHEVLGEACTYACKQRAELEKEEAKRRAEAQASVWDSQSPLDQPRTPAESLGQLAAPLTPLTPITPLGSGPLNNGIGELPALPAIDLNASPGELPGLPALPPLPGQEGEGSAHPSGTMSPTGIDLNAPLGDASTRNDPSGLPPLPGIPIPEPGTSPTLPHMAQGTGTGTGTGTDPDKGASEPLSARVAPPPPLAIAGITSATHSSSSSSSSSMGTSPVSLRAASPNGAEFAPWAGGPTSPVSPSARQRFSGTPRGTPRELTPATPSARSARGSSRSLRAASARLYRAPSRASLRIRASVNQPATPTTAKTSPHLFTSRESTRLETGHSFRPVHRHVINPKAVSLAQLYGHPKKETDEWEEGLFSYAIRSCAKDESGDHHWVILDGVVAAEWVENMNTLLDDSKMLFLSSGERINLPKTVRVLFETDHLQAASPATVSRCGMVFMDPTNLGYKPLVRVWIDSLKEKSSDVAAIVEPIMELYLSHMLKFLRRSCNEPLPTVDVGLVQSFLSLLGSLLAPLIPVEEAPEQDGKTETETMTTLSTRLDDAAAPEGPNRGPMRSSVRAEDVQQAMMSGRSRQRTPPTRGRDASRSKSRRRSQSQRRERGKSRARARSPDESEYYSDESYDEDTDEEGDSDAFVLRHSEIANKAHFAGKIEAVFLFALIWSLGSGLDPKGRAQFDSELRKMFVGECAPHFSIPTSHPVFDYRFDTSSVVPQWVLWLPDKSVPYSLPLDATLHDVLVPTVDSIRLTNLLRELTLAHRPTLVCGNTGTGKTVVIRELLYRGSSLPDQYATLFMNFSATTSVQGFQSTLDHKIERRRNNEFGPTPLGQHLVVFVDDLNLPTPESESGAQPPLELIRQWLDMGGWYDTSQQSFGQFKQIHDMHFLAAAGTPGGGRSTIPPRLLRHLHVLNAPEPDDIALTRIFNSILRAHLIGFEPTILELIPHVIEATIAAYRQVCQNLRPKLSKAHYLFNPRDIFRVLHGLLFSEQNVVVTADSFVRLWWHESLRVFHDRLVDEDDRTWLKDQLTRLSLRHFSMWSDPIPTNVKVIFGDYLSNTNTYEEIRDQDHLVGRLQSYLDDYNDQVSTPMHLVLFEDAVEHLSRICRILRQPKGHALLLGVGGSGRQSLAKLAAFTSECEITQVEISRNYDVQHWHEDLKALLQKVGNTDTRHVFLWSDTQLVSPACLEDISNLLQKGEVPNLFSEDEQDAIIRNLQSAYTASSARGDASSARETAREGISDKQQIWEFFVHRIQDNLHIILCLSPSHMHFRDWLRQYPSLVACCTIDWFSKWPKGALRAVGKAHIGDSDFLEGHTEHALRALVEACVHIHETSSTMCDVYRHEMRRHAYVTPTSYLELLKTFKHLVRTKTFEFQKKIGRLENGLSILAKTGEEVTKNEAQLERLVPELEATTIELNQLMIDLSKQTEEVNLTKQIAQEKEETAEKELHAAKRMHEQADAELRTILPDLLNAQQAVNQLKPSAIAEIRRLMSPPPAMTIVIEPLCIILGKSPRRVEVPGKPGVKVDDYWPEARLLFGKINFLRRLQEFDPKTIQPDTMRKLKPYIDNPNFKPQAVRQTNHALMNLCTWIISCYNYSLVWRKVSPVLEREEETNKRYQETMEVLNSIQQTLSSLEENIVLLTEQKETAQKRKDQIEKEVEENRVRLKRATTLTSSLADERVTWQQRVEQYRRDFHSIIGNMLLAAGAIVFWGPFTSSYRKRLQRTWEGKLDTLSIEYTRPFSLKDVLSDPIQQHMWMSCGLPSDDTSIENAICVTKGQRWPLMIDPQGQAANWTENVEREDHIDVAKAVDQDALLRALGNSIQFGRPFLLLNCPERLDPALDPLIAKQTFDNAGRQYVRLAEREYLYNPQFRLYLATRLANPQYSPETAARVNLINFTVTHTGLAEQLLSTVVSMEESHLEREKTELIKTNARLLKEQQDMEETILQQINSCEAHQLLDDEEVIHNLTASQRMSEEVKAQGAHAEENRKRIDRARQRYAPVARHASTLFFCVSALAALDPMYQYSLVWFRSIFENSLSSVPKTSDRAERMRLLNQALTYNVYSAVTRSLFEKDKLTFSFLLMARILRQDNQLDPAEWNFLLSGAGISKRPSVANSLPWMPEPAWVHLNELSRLPAFHGLCQDILKQPSRWHRLYESPAPHRDAFPGKWQELSSFQKHLVLRCLRPERVIACMRDLISEHLGPEFIKTPSFDLGTIFKETKPTIPLVFILSPGADPNEEIDAFAVKEKMSTKLKKLSLGEGQGKRAEESIRDAVNLGFWVLLQNCHLAGSWLPTLGQLVDSISPSRSHPRFRLLLTSMPTRDFPVSVLQRSVKVTNEPPQSIKDNLKRSIHSISEFAHRQEKYGDRWAKMAFSLCHFHAVVHERRRFGPLGWNVKYEFNTNDLQTSLRQFEFLLQESERGVSFLAARYLIGSCFYGGRITDSHDQRLLAAILNDYCQEAVFRPGYTFSQSGTYHIPEATDLESYLRYAEELPGMDGTEIFGLHPNAEQTSLRNETTRIFEDLLSMQPRQSGAGGESSSRSDAGGATGIARAAQVRKPEDSESIESVVATRTQELRDNLPLIINMEEVHKRYPVQASFNLDLNSEDISMSSSSTYNNVLHQEVLHYNHLIAVIRESLEECDQALQGLKAMSKELEELFKNIFELTVPKCWSRHAYPSLKSLGSWMKDLSTRVEWLRMWSGGSLPTTFWLPAFVFPHAFLTATLQNFVRSGAQVAIDTVRFETEVMDQPRRRGPPSGCYINGLFLEGARWETEARVLAEPAKDIHTEFPVIWLRPTVIEGNYTRPEGTYTCPIYRTLARQGVVDITGHSSNYIISVDLPIGDVPESHWVKRGAALFCSTSD